MAAALSPEEPPLSALVIAGTASGVGKTSVTLGLLGALRRRGQTVQPFKVGPDFIDPLHHERAAGRPSRTLDGWMLDAPTNRERLALASCDADVAVVEGVMGLYDGSEGATDRGSTAEMAKLLGLPVVLVCDVGAMARSAAALIHGFTTFDPDLRFAGVILNNVGGAAHAAMIGDAVAGAIPILGALPRVPDLVMPERHLGLHLPHEARAGYVEALATLIEEHVDLDRLLESNRIERPTAATPVPRPGRATVRVGVARDEAFCFYYRDNLELLERAGAELVDFSPLVEPLPPDLDGIYLGGGYPELHATALAANAGAREAIRAFAAGGGPVYGECGGLMYLADRLEVGEESYPMCGVLPLVTRMPAGLQIGYVEVTTVGGLFGPGHVARGHVFHHSALAGAEPDGRSYRMRRARGGDEVAEGYSSDNVLASYAHLHFASDPTLAPAFVERCRAFAGGRVRAAGAGAGAPRRD